MAHPAVVDARRCSCPRPRHRMPSSPPSPPRKSTHGVTASKEGPRGETVYALMVAHFRLTCAPVFDRLRDLLCPPRATYGPDSDVSRPRRSLLSPPQPPPSPTPFGHADSKPICKLWNNAGPERTGGGGVIPHGEGVAYGGITSSVPRIRASWTPMVGVATFSKRILRQTSKQ